MWVDERVEERADHECPTPLDKQVEHFQVGGMFFSPAGRWETITGGVQPVCVAGRVTVHTDRTGDGYGWTFWPSDRFPYLSPWRVTPAAEVRVVELPSMVDVEIAQVGRCGGGHILVQARMVRGTGWVITDWPDGATVEHVTVPNRARARAEVNRRARAHAKRLGLPVHRGGEGR